MPKTRFSVMLDPEHLQFLEEMVRRGEAETLGQAIRKCINFYRNTRARAPKLPWEKLFEDFLKERRVKREG